MKELLRQKTYQGCLSKVNSPLDPSFKLRQLKYDIFLIMIMMMMMMMIMITIIIAN